MWVTGGLLTPDRSVFSSSAYTWLLLDRSNPREPDPMRPTRRKFPCQQSTVTGSLLMRVRLLFSISVDDWLLVDSSNPRVQCLPLPKPRAFPRQQSIGKWWRKVPPDEQNGQSLSILYS